MIPLSSPRDEIVSHLGTPLEEHLGEVAKRCATDADGREKRFYEIIGACHDFGKATSYFQEYIRSEREQSSRTNHAAISGLACFHALRADDFDDLACATGWYVVDRHHSPMTDVDGDGGVFERALDHRRRIPIYHDQVESVKNPVDVQRIYDSLDVPLDVSAFVDWILDNAFYMEIRNAMGYGGRIDEPPRDSCYHAIEAYARLVSADKLCAAGYALPERATISTDAVERHVRETFGAPEEGSLDARREAARQAVREGAREHSLSEHVATITLPTGIGKTLSGFDAALTLRERLRTETDEQPRIVYALPFTAIIDQNYEVLRGVLGVDGHSPDSLLKHHHLASGYLDGRASEGEPTDDEADRAAMLTERWESEVVVTTFVQLLESLLVPSNRQSLKLPNLRNAVVLLDEVQSIPVRYWDLIADCFRALGERWNCYFLAMTATQPALFDDAPELVSAPGRFYEVLDRVSFDFHDSICTEPLSVPEFAALVVAEAERDPTADVLIVCNTVDAATRLCEHLADHTPVATNELVYLSSAVRPIDRSSRIDALGDPSREERRIVVSTQVVEAGVDIDMDAVIRDFAPLDSIVQAAGRCNRNDGATRGTVRVARMDGEDDLKPPGQVIYDAPRLEATRTVVESHGGFEQALSESAVTNEAVPTYFKELETVKNTGESLVELLHRWRFEDAKISLIDNVQSEDIFIERNDADVRTREAFVDAIRRHDRAAIATHKPAFYERVVTVRTYDDRSERATAIGRLPTISEHSTINVRRIDTTGRYEDWHHERTGFRIAADTVSERLI